MELLKETFQKYSNERKKQARYSILNSVKVDGCNNKNSLSFSRSVSLKKKERRVERERESLFMPRLTTLERVEQTNT